MTHSRFFWIFFIAAIFLPRIVLPNIFFIQDEQPWIDRSQMYVNSLLAGEFSEAVRFPLSNHPAIPLMTAVGPVMNFYGSYHGLKGTYTDWDVDNKREAAVWARYTWGIVCSFALLLLYLVVAKLRIMDGNAWMAALVVILLGIEPWVLGISRAVSVDVLMAIGVVGMLASAVVAFEKNDLKWVVVSGAWFGLAFVSKSPALITAPIAIVVSSVVFPLQWKQAMYRLLLWILSAYVAIVFLWPPFFLHPIARISDVLGRAELHSTVQEIYYWPGFHPPFFIFILSTFSFVGCLLYIWNRISETRVKGFFFFGLDFVLLAGIFHGLVLVYLNGDHARKNLPVLVVLAFIGAVGWVWFFQRNSISKAMTIFGLLSLQGIFVLSYFPHVISVHNIIFSTISGRRLLVDVGNGAKLVADYINRADDQEVFAIPMDSLILPLLDGSKRDSIRGMPSGGKISNVGTSVSKIVISASLPARVDFDTEAKQLLEDLKGQPVEAVLSVKDVPMFYIYSISSLEYTTNHETGI